MFGSGEVGSSVAKLEWTGPNGRFGSAELAAADGGRVLGRNPDSDIVIEHDAAVSGTHAKFEYLGRAWFVLDLGSRNGTDVNDTRIAASHRLRDRDKLKIGNTAFVFYDEATQGDRTTSPIKPPPKPLPLPALTNAEKRVLLELCRPWFAAPEDRKSFTVPTSVADIATALVVGKGAVQQHLEHLYDKFGIRPEQSGDRRVRLANEVIERKGLTDVDYESPPPEEPDD